MNFQKYFYILVFIIICKKTSAQVELKDFAPLGAIWSYWDVTFGGGNRNFTWITRPSDTLVQGIKFKRFDISSVDYVGNEKWGYKIYTDKYFTAYFNRINDTNYMYDKGKIYKYHIVDTIGFKIYPFQDTCFQAADKWFELKAKFNKVEYDYKYFVRVYSNNIDTILDTAYSYDAPAFSPYLNFFYLSPKNRKSLRHNNFVYNKCENISTHTTGYREFSCYFDSTVGFISYGFGFCEFLFKKENASISNASKNVHIQIIDDFLFLDLSEFKYQSINYKITNAIGAIINQNGTESNRISLEKLQKGYYTLIIDIDGIKTIFKFIK